jgi:low density lipoprotein-related protein 2
MKTISFLNITAAERPRPSPRICPCQNGQCQEDDQGDVICVCLDGFSGSHCEHNEGATIVSGSGSAAAIFVPILVIILFAAAIGSWFIIKRRPLYE